MGYKNNDNSDPQGLINHEDTSWENFKKKDEAYDQWDDQYGDGKADFEVYVLTDGTRPLKVEFGPLEFTHEPFYVGQGRIKDRVRESKALGRQKDKYCAKTAHMMEIIEQRGGSVREIIVGRYQTQEKAKLVERKIMNTIHKSFLTNGVTHFCEVPLTEADCNVMHEGDCINGSEVGPLTC